MFVPVNGRVLKSQAQQLVLNLLSYFEREKENGGTLLSLAKVQEVCSTFQA